ncbi:MAG: glycosyltransferase, partial [Muribaculaceae bacterium]|nr:glycosyltransferase [Muribaculaceae bacterium]
AIATTLKARTTLEVMGANRLNFKMGFRFTISPRIHFHGMVDNLTKASIIERSSGLLFPVTWHEPFGLAVIESLYYGAPVFATPYGALPELVNEQVGVLSAEASTLIDAMRHNHFDPNVCHQYAADCFNDATMARHYLQLYERVLNGEQLQSTPPVQSTTANARNLPYIV